MLDRIDCIQSFVRVVELGSFSAVAKERNTTQPTISKQIAALEEYLDVKLFLRSTRRVALTEDGNQFYQHCLALIEVFNEAECSVGKRQEPTGILRISCSSSFGQSQIIPRLPKFLTLHPGIQIDINMVDYYVDLIEENIDLAIRIGKYQSSKFRSVCIGKTRLVTVASNQYLEKHTTPKHPRELSEHNCIIYTRQISLNEWHFKENQDEFIIPVSGNLRINDSSGLKQAILAGLGVGTSPLWIFEEELRQQTVQVILSSFEPPPLPIQVILKRKGFQPAKVKSFLQFLSNEFPS